MVCTDSLAFSPSKNLTLGAEIELQLLDPLTGDLTPKIDLFLDHIKKADYQGEIKPEITHSMLEITSNIHHSAHALEKELRQLNRFLIQEAKKIGIHISGGGTHPFHTWQNQTISTNYEKIYKKYDYLVKKFTVFGQHIHIGCSDPDMAIYLIHAFSLSGHFPLVKNWAEFLEYLNKLQQLNVVEQVRNFYWDIRLRPDFGTLEIRICDAPLTLKQAAALAAYCQTLALYFMEEKPVCINDELYLAYNHNGFQASRYGYKGKISVLEKKSPIVIGDDILETLEKLAPYAKYLNNEHYLKKIKKDVIKKNNGATKIKEAFKNLHHNIVELTNFQSQLWMHKSNC